MSHFDTTSYSSVVANAANILRIKRHIQVEKEVAVNLKRALLEAFIQMEETSRVRRDPPSSESYTNRDPPTAYDNFIQNRRQQSKKIASEKATKPHSTIRFSDNLEVHEKQPPNHRSDASTTSILRASNKANHSSAKAISGRKESLLEKLNQRSQEEENSSASQKMEPLGPARPRKDWNIQALFPSGEERKQNSRQMMKRSRMVDLSGGIHTRVSMHEQCYSSDYLLNKYAEKYSVLSGASTNISTPSVSQRSIPDSANVPTKSEEYTDQFRGRQVLDSTPNERLPSQGRFSKPNIGRKRELSYLQLEQRNPHGDDPDFNSTHGYNLANLVQRYVSDSPKSSVASYDDVLVRKSTSDTDISNGESASKQMEFHFDNSDFQNSRSRRPRRVLKKWAVWVLAGTVCFCVVSTLLVYLLSMREGRGASMFDDKIGVDECTRHGHTNGRFVSDRYDTIRYHLLFQGALNVTMMDEPDSPQRRALCWISEFDDYNIDASKENRESIIQRYSLAVIYFSTFGESKKRHNDFGTTRDSNILSPIHECEWDDVICNHAQEVIILRFSRKMISGKIPDEMGNLKRLST